MTLMTVFPNGFTTQIIVIRSPFNLFRVHADNFLYWDEEGERHHVCTQSIENWAAYNGVQIIGSKFEWYQNGQHNNSQELNNHNPVGR